MQKRRGKRGYRARPWPFCFSFVPEGGAPGKKAAGELRTREDALRLLDRICDFIERSEPSSPAPLLIRRAQRLMTMNFVEILEDIAPDGLTQARNITGMAKK